MKPDPETLIGDGLRFPEQGLGLADARLIVVVPPFASADRPSLGAEIIGRVACDHGFPAQILYANLSFAALLGVRDYSRLCHTPTGHLLGERAFARAMYGSQASAETEEEVAAALRQAVVDSKLDLAQLQEMAERWADFYALRLAALPAEIIGFTSTFEQTLASLALIERIKRHAPSKTLILGGANVDGPMADAVAALSSAIDHVFAGESEAAFGDFLAATAKSAPRNRVIRGSPNLALDDLPDLDYGAYASQLSQTVAAGVVEGGLCTNELWMPYESSRGCWWGAKHHCTFCGLNALGMGYREKKPAKVLGELMNLTDRYPEAQIMMVDNIMPFSYFSSLIPELARQERRFKIFYEQKANITLSRMRLLAAAGIGRIQPGIESLDTSVLKLMRKGSSLRTNLECLRYARSMKIDVTWNLLVDFPNEEDTAYESMAALIPLLAHLPPPSGVAPLSIERFSPYFDERDAFGIDNLRPVAAYSAAHPGMADTSGIAYHFTGDYPSTYRRRPELIRSIERQVNGWKAAWTEHDTLPLLEIIELSEERYLICDLRPCAKVEADIIDPDRARFCLAGIGDREDAAWALERGYAWEADGQVIPLALASEDCMLRFIDR